MRKHPRHAPPIGEPTAGRARILVSRPCIHFGFHIHMDSRLHIYLLIVWNPGISVWMKPYKCWAQYLPTWILSIHGSARGPAGRHLWRAARPGQAPGAPASAGRQPKRPRRTSVPCTQDGKNLSPEWMARLVPSGSNSGSNSECSSYKLLCLNPVSWGLAVCLSFAHGFCQ